jgi:DNA-binding CsgD family transcriptional regulator/DNA polymerase III delta prime subunit
MPERVSELGEEIVGREAEIVVLREFVKADSLPGAALVLSGEPGSGKTTLWEAGVAAARERGIRVLKTRASGAEAQLSFAALIDLLDGVHPPELDGLPKPQLHALEVALLRAEPVGAPPESRAIALGFLNALRALGASEPLLVAIDDVKWLDPPSAEALAFAARRLDADAVGFLLARRLGQPSSLERALEPKLDRLEVGPLSLGAIRRLLSKRLALSLPRQLLRKLVEATAGNPLFALEFGRTLVEEGLPAIGSELPVPETIEDLLGTRVARLPVHMRRLLLAVALSADLTTSQLAAVADTASVDAAVEARLLLVDGDRVRASHPLLAAAARKRSRGPMRRELHLELAGIVADEELRALHLALATELPDAELAATVAAAAAGASSRGARQEAAELAGHALRLTPPEAPERTDRLFSLARYLDMAGDVRRLTDLLVSELESLPSGSARARAYLLLAEGVVANNDEIQRYLERALAESQGDVGLRAYVLVGMTSLATSIRVDRIREAEAWALEALAGARLAGTDVERPALDALAWARGLRGVPVDDVCERFRAVSDTAVYVATSPERLAGQRLAWRGEIDRARTVHTRLQSLADEQGEGLSYALQGLHLCELELRAGGWETASRLLDEVVALDEVIASSDSQLLTFPIYERCRALLAAGRGLPEEAERWAAEAIARAEASGGGWDLLEARRAVGIAALLAHEPARAAESLRVVWEHTEREGVDEPGVFPVAPELVEALVELGELDEALAVTARLRDLAEGQDHPWGLVTVKRCDALIRLAASSYDEGAAAELAEAAGGYGELGLRFDRARALLSLGRVQRRLRKWGAARGSLEQAASAFEEIGSTGWAEAARSELARVGARRPRAAGELTEAERRVVELAVAGLSNKEIARTLVVTVPTVEGHLSKAYAKLGVRSRAQLAGRLSAGT